MVKYQKSVLWFLNVTDVPGWLVRCDVLLKYAAHFDQGLSGHGQRGLSSGFSWRTHQRAIPNLRVYEVGVIVIHEECPFEAI
jgi:hypothetical protein